MSEKLVASFSDIDKSIENLPTVKELRRKLEGLKLISSLFGNDAVSEEADCINRRLDKIVGVVKKFYQLLGVVCQ